MPLGAVWTLETRDPAVRRVAVRQLGPAANLPLRPVEQFRCGLNARARASASGPLWLAGPQLLRPFPLVEL